MRARFMPAAVLLCLAVLAGVARPSRGLDPRLAGEAKPVPTVIVRIKSLDALRADFKYLATLAGKEEQVLQLEALLKSRTNNKEREAFDTRRPIGLYGTPGPAGTDSTAVVMLPVADEKAVLDLLAKFDFKPKKNDDGIYTVTPEGSTISVYFRFAHKYAYVTFRDDAPIAKDKLLTPAEVLPPGQTGLISASVRIDQITDDLKQIAASQLDLRLADLRERKIEGGTKVQKAVSEQAFKEIGSRLKSVLQEGREVTFKLDVDRQTDDVSLEMSLDGKPGSQLATSIADLAQAKSLFGSLIHRNSAASILVHYALPDKLRKTLGPRIDEGIRKIVEHEQDETNHALAEKVLKALAPSLKTGELDMAVDLRGPSAKKKYTLVAAIKVKDGESIEQAIKELVKGLPEEVRDLVKFDAEKVGEVNIHRIDAEKFINEEDRALFGTEPIYLAISSRAMYAAGGEHGLKALKEALTLGPKAAPLLQTEVSLGRLAALMARDQKAAPKAAEEAFGQDKDKDKVRIIVEGGQALKVRISMKAHVIKFFQLLQEAEAGGADK